MPILDQYGRPYPSAPAKPVNLAKMARIQQPGQRWAVPFGHVSPDRLFHILHRAAAGDQEQYLTLAMEIEERYLHYASQLATRKNAVCGTEIEVVPGDASERAQQVADAFKANVVDDDCFHDMLMQALDALGKGYSCQQIHWDTTRRPWAPREYEWCDQRLFQFDIDTLTELRLRQNGNVDGLELPAGLIVHRPKVRTGVTVRAGLARPAAVAYLFASSTLNHWHTFAEVFGMPLRLGTYDSGTSTDQEIEELRTALINLGHDAAAMIPSGMSIQFADARRPTSGDNVYQAMVEYWDAQISKIVLGQTMTSDAVGQRGAQAEVHNDVRLDFKKADARGLQATVRRDLATPFTLWNFGEGAPVPHIRLKVEPEEDLQVFSDAITPLILAGLDVDSEEVRSKFGLSKPAAGAEVIRIAPPPAAAPGATPSGRSPVAG